MKRLTALREIKEALTSEANVYVRWGDPLKDDLIQGRSWNHQTGLPEPGLSCNLVPQEDSYYPQDSHIWDALAEYWHPHYREGVVPYLLRGTVTGRGSDGEPCIQKAQIIGILDPSLILSVHERDRIKARERLEKEELRLLKLKDPLAIKGCERDIRLEKAKIAAFERGLSLWDIERIGRGRLGFEVDLLEAWLES